MALVERNTVGIENEVCVLVEAEVATATRDQFPVLMTCAVVLPAKLVLVACARAKPQQLSSKTTTAVAARILRDIELRDLISRYELGQ